MSTSSLLYVQQQLYIVGLSHATKSPGARIVFKTATMQFKLLTIATAFAGLVAAQKSELTPQTVVKSIEAVTDLSQDANNILTDLSFNNVFSLIPKALSNIREIAGAVRTDITMIAEADTSKPFPADGQNQVCEVFRDFVRVHQALLNTIIGKSSFLSGTPFTAPITGVLRTIEGGVDKLAFGIIDLVPTCKKGLASDKKDLDASFKKTFEAL
ncbi:hypothetical protein VDGE_06236 [Verticillium dahliae]|uniref:Cell wall galactomannoprotein n=1 Tax=Verticillium dahliae TaxID=27337 RepID=A0A444RPK5_VERDA|nr:hypothetical protein VDGE_06236 [Verticillium dahliae]